MKIVQIMPEFGLAGAEIMCENLVYGLKKNGHEVIVISLYDYHSAITSRMESNGINVIYLHKKHGVDLSVLRRLYRLLNKVKPDVIHAHRYLTYYAIPTAVLAKVPVRIHTIHSVASYDNHGIGRFLNRIFYHSFRTIPVALSESIRKTIADTYKINTKRIPVIYNGIDLSKLIIKKDYQLNECTRLLHIGRFVDVKNHYGLIDAFSLISKEYDNIQLLLIGEGALLDEIRDYVRSKNLDNKVVFLGSVDDCSWYLSQADIFVLSSKIEGMPMTLIEAMGTGLPIVATNVGGIPDMLDRSCSILVNPDALEISNAVSVLLKNTNERERLGIGAKNRAREFSSSLMANKYESLYLDVLNNMGIGAGE